MTAPDEAKADGGVPAPARRPAAPPLQVEHTHWSLGLIGFYLSCIGTMLGATIAAAGWFFFHSKGAIVFGAVLAAASIVGCFYSLAAARRRPEP